MKRWKPMLFGILILVMLLYIATPVFLASEREHFPTQAMEMVAIPDSRNLCLISLDNGVTSVQGYDPAQDRVIYKTSLNWRHDACFATGDNLVFTRQDSRFDTETNTFRFALQVTTVHLADGSLGSSIALNNLKTSVGRMAVTNSCIAVIDDDASHSVLLYDLSGTLHATIQTGFDNLRIEGTDGTYLFLSHSESEALYSLSLESDLPANQLPTLLSGVQKPLVAAWDGLLLTGAGIYHYDPVAGTAVKGLDLPVTLAARYESRSYFTSGTSLCAADNKSLLLMYSADTQAHILALCANADGLWQLVFREGEKALVLLPETDIVPPETEHLSGDLYPVPDRASWEDVWQQAARGLPTSRDQLFSDPPSVAAPFWAGQVDPGVLEQVAKVLNTCRTMAGLPPLSADISGSASLQYGAVLLSADAAVPVNSRKPEGMDDSFYNSGLHGIQSASALFLDADVPLDDLISRLFYATTSDFHSNFFRPETRTFQIGMAPSVTDGVTALFSLQKNGTGDFKRQFYCWPSHGAFPVEYAHPLSHWLVLFPPDLLLVREEKLTATITDQTGKSWITGITEQEGTLAISPPSDIQEGDRYTLRIEGLERSNGHPVTLSLQYEFFRLIRIYPDQLTLYRRDTSQAGESLSPVTAGLTMKAGEAFTLIFYLSPKNTTEKEIKISVKPTGVVRADSDGAITALSPGEAVITVEAAGGLQAHLPITVTAKTPEGQEDNSGGGQGSGGISSDVYDLDREAGFIYNIDPATTVAKFRKNLQFSGAINVRRPDGQVVTGTIGTGCLVELIREGQVVERWTALVSGDVTGEGNVNSRDITAIRRHILRETPLEGPYLRAADTDHDSRVSSLDILLVTRYHLGKGNLPKTDIL